MLSGQKRRVGAAIVMGAILAAMASPALASQVFDANFNGLDGGASAANLTSLSGTGLDINAGRAVDLFKSGEGGVTCGPGYTSCISLESSDGRYGQLLSHSTFLAHAGDVVTMSFELSGNQRSDPFGLPDIINAGITWTPLLLPGTITYTGPWSEVFTPVVLSTGILNNSPLASDYPFHVYTESFVAPQDMNVRVRILGGNPGNQANAPSDGVGPILDYIALDITTPSAAPEPSTWAMLLAGFGGLGADMRRRRARYA